MRAPKKVYFVAVEGTKPHYGDRGGGLFTVLRHAAARGKRVTQNAGTFKLYEGTVVWQEIDAPDVGRYGI